MQSRLPSLLYQIIFLRRESSGTGRGWRERRQKSCRIQTHFFLRNWHDKKTSHISLFGSGGEREQEILGTVKFGRSYLFMAVFLFKACEDLSYYHWLIPSFVRKNLFSSFFLLLHPFLHTFFFDHPVNPSILHIIISHTKFRVQDSISLTLPNQFHLVCFKLVRCFTGVKSDIWIMRKETLVSWAWIFLNFWTFANS